MLKNKSESNTLKILISLFSMKIGFFQFEPKFLEVEENINLIISELEKTQNFDLLVLPELANSGYVFKNKEELRKVAEEIPKGVFIFHLEDICKNKNAYVVSGVAEKKGSTFFNSSVLIGPEGYISTYRKLHLFDREKLFFEPGNKPLEIYDIGKAKVGLMICFDWIFPETTRILALKGAEIICHSANLVLPYSQTAMLARSVENAVYTITANRIGVEKNDEISLNFTGQSQITSPKMETLAKAGKDTVELKTVDIDPEIAKNKWINERNNLFKDRRIEYYSILTEK